MKTNQPIKRKYHLFDCSRENAGRMATRIARVLMGKHMCTYEPHLDGGDFAVAINAAKTKFSGNKAEAKMYHTFSGYPGGIRSEKLADLMERSPEKVLRQAVYNMLPKNKLRDRMIKRLLIYRDEQHGLKVEFSK